jgi:hypothetical protein
MFYYSIRLILNVAPNKLPINSPVKCVLQNIKNDINNISKHIEWGSTYG